MVTVPSLIHLRKAGWPVYWAGLNLCRIATRHWSNPVRRLRRELGLRSDCDPVFRDKFSPDLVLALFSHHLGARQVDWPSQTVQPGFVFYDRHKVDARQSAVLASFLASGDPPLVFTMGSTAVHNAGDFYEASVEATKQLGRRAILLGAKTAPGTNNPDILALSYAPYSQIFPHAQVIVHQGGSGTTGQALHAGRPMLIVPYGWDQPDNGARVQRLGTGLCLPRSAYSARTAAVALRRLLEGSRFAIRAAEVGAGLQSDDGLKLAGDAVQSVLAGA